MTKQGTVVVTGATGGMGYALCRLLIHPGYQVVELEINENKLQDFTAELNNDHFLGLAGDIASEESAILIDRSSFLS